MCTTWHLCQCQLYARECIQACVQWSRHIQTSQEWHWFTVYTGHSVDLIGKCTFLILGKDTKQPVEVDFYIAKDDSSGLLSCETVFQLQLLDVKPRLEYLPSRVTLISSAVDYPRKEVHAQSRSIKQQHGTKAAHSGSISANSWSIIVQNGCIMQQEDSAKKIKIIKNQGANKRIVSRTLQRNRQISRWTMPHLYISIC